MPKEAGKPYKAALILRLKQTSVLSEVETYCCTRTVDDTSDVDHRCSWSTWFLQVLP